MKKILCIVMLSIATSWGAFAQSSGQARVATTVKTEKHLSSSILLWMRTDRPRQAGMDQWKGPHAKIIAANKGLLEYRQIHFAEVNPGLWQPIPGVETTIPESRKIDGVADVTLKGLFSIFKGKEQNKLAFADEVNLFKRTILYAAFPKNSHWYHVAENGSKIEAGAMVFFRKKTGVKDKEFAKFMQAKLTPALANTGMLSELRDKFYSTWKQKQWDTPNVLHDNGIADQFQFSLMLGFASKDEMEKFLRSEAVMMLSGGIAAYCSAVHAYEISETITFVSRGAKVN
jgi:hypothetical protein